MRRNRQLSIDEKQFKRPDDRFGGDLLKRAHARSKRPLDSKMPIHLTLRATEGVLRLHNTRSIVAEEVERWSKISGITIFKWANVGNHLHLVIQTGKRQLWHKFIRGLTGSLALKIQKRLNRKFKLWKHRPFTRIVRSWKQPFKRLLEYVTLNQWEADGNISRASTKSLRELHVLWSENQMVDLTDQRMRRRYPLPI